MSRTAPRRLPHRLLAIAVATVLLVLIAIPASAHVTVRTDNPSADGFAVYTVRVPNERDDAGTTTIEVQVPEEVAASRYLPIPGWDIELVDNVLTVSGGTIEPGQYLDVSFQARNPAEPGEFAFPAIQTYEGGEVVEWTGPADGDTPASVIEIVAAAEGEDGHGDGHSAEGDEGTEAAEDTATEATSADAEATEEPAAAAGVGGNDTLSMVALAAGLLGLVLGGMAFVRSGKA